MTCWLTCWWPAIDRRQKVLLSVFARHGAQARESTVFSLALGDGDSVALSGSLSQKVWTDKE